MGVENVWRRRCVSGASSLLRRRRSYLNNAAASFRLKENSPFSPTHTGDLFLQVNHQISIFRFFKVLKRKLVFLTNYYPAYCLQVANLWSKEEYFIEQKIERS